MSQYKQVILMRSDTNPKMRTGKMVAQGGHGVMSFIFHRMKKIEGRRYEIELTEAEEFWKEGNFAKVCLKVTLKEMIHLHQKSIELGLQSYIVTDSGLTEFDNIPTETCVVIGPDLSEKIDLITGHLSLM